MTNFNIDIVSDTVCPWCYVGKKRLEKGIATFKAKHPERQDTFSTTWLPYYLNPNAGKSVDKQQAYFTKFGEERTIRMQGMLTDIGKQEGINFQYGGKTGKTRDSHRLIQLAKSKGPDMQNQVVSQLFKAYFEEEKDITSEEVLLAAGTEAGLDKAEVKKLLESDEYGEKVDTEVAEARENLISGVPHFTIDETFEVNGAQEPEAFVVLFERLLKIKSKA